MNYNQSHKQNTAGIIRYSCSILFMLFSFCYLYCLKGEILAEAQFVYSKGVTTYNLLVGAIVVTLILQTIQWVVDLLLRLPARWHAMSYVPSMLMLAMLSDVNQETIGHFSFGEWAWIAPLVFILYGGMVVLLKRWNNDDKIQEIRALLYPNYMTLFVLMLAVGAIPQSSDVYHFELKAERLILNGDYEGAAQVGKNSLRTSARLTQLRMYALSRQGLLPECIFEYPQYYGTQGLLDVNDTLYFDRISAEDICLHLGALCGKSIHNTHRYLEVMLSDSIWNDHTADYYLCSLLLDRKLNEFRQHLPLYYNLADSVPDAYNRLPKAYLEALMLMGNRDAVLQGKLLIGKDTLATLTNNDMVARFRDYTERQREWTDSTERVNRMHREFGNTYWWYYDYSYIANGELKKK